MARQQKQQDKTARRLETRRQKETRSPDETEDPEIAGIRPGPQPPPAWMEPPQKRS
jgi:hypothetical protein